MDIEHKGFLIVSDGQFAMKKIKFPGQGGSLPKSLEGLFTRPNEGKCAIDHYLAMKQEKDDRPPPVKKIKLTPREPKDGKADSISNNK